MAAQAKEDWDKAMSELAHEEPELLQHFQKLSEAAGKVGKAYRSNHHHLSIVVCPDFICYIFYLYFVFCFYINFLETYQS